MAKKLLTIIISLNILQGIIYLFGFFNRIAIQTNRIPLIDVTHIWYNFGGIVYWTILSMVSVIGFTLTLYLLLSKSFQNNQTVGLIISAIGYGSPILFSFFLVIPATLLILGLIFIYLLIVNPEKEKVIDEL